LKLGSVILFFLGINVNKGMPETTIYVYDPFSFTNEEWKKVQDQTQKANLSVQVYTEYLINPNPKKAYPESLNEIRHILSSSCDLTLNVDLDAAYKFIQETICKHDPKNSRCYYVYARKHGEKIAFNKECFGLHDSFKRCIRNNFNFIKSVQNRLLKSPTLPINFNINISEKYKEKYTLPPNDNRTYRACNKLETSISNALCLEKLCDAAEISVSKVVEDLRGDGSSSLIYIVGNCNRRVFKNFELRNRPRRGRQARLGIMKAEILCRCLQVNFSKFLKPLDVKRPEGEVSKLCIHFYDLPRKQPDNVPDWIQVLRVIQDNPGADIKYHVINPIFSVLQMVNVRL
jgi:hypothetical protein